MAAKWSEKDVTVSLAAENLKPLKTRDGLVLTPDKTFHSYYEGNLQSDLIWVPVATPNRLKSS